MLERILAGHKRARGLDLSALPYEFGGGHPEWDGRSGLDCSSSASIVIRAEGNLGVPRPWANLDTEQFEMWGQPGQGRYRTLWVTDSPLPNGQHHCFIQYVPALLEHLPAAYRAWQFFQAPHTGELVGFHDPSGHPWVLSTAGFHPRRTEGS